MAVCACVCWFVVCVQCLQICVFTCWQVLVADVKKWIADVEDCLGQSSPPVDDVDGLQCELRESQVSAQWIHSTDSRLIFYFLKNLEYHYHYFGKMWSVISDICAVIPFVCSVFRLCMNVMCLLHKTAKIVVKPRDSQLHSVSSVACIRLTSDVESLDQHRHYSCRQCDEPL